MFLASFDGLGPIASVLLFVVEETTDTELFDGCAVPAGPVTDAARFVSENTVLPVTRSVANRWVCYLEKFKNYFSILFKIINPNSV